MANFKTTDCIPKTTSFFAELQYDAESYSCQWNTKNVPDVDFEDERPIYLQVLAKHNISVHANQDTGGLPPGGTLPGMDIHNMDAIEAIRLSLAEALIRQQWWEIVEDGEGGVYFQRVFDLENPILVKKVTLDPRMCIPTAARTNEVDMVVVTGYDPPPCRYAGEFREVISSGPGDVNPITIPGGMFTIDESLLFENYCQGKQLQNTATKSYPDPLIEDSGIFQGQVQNPFFDPKAFEKLVTWVIKVSGMPLANEDAAKVSYNFSKTTAWLYPITDTVNFAKVTDNSAAAFSCPGTFTQDSITYYQTEIRVKNQDYVDKYGTNWPLFIKPTNLLYMGYKITKAHSFPTGAGTSTSYVFVDPVPALISAGEGTNWVYSLDGDDFVITIFYQPKTDITSWEDILSVVANGGGNQIEIKVDNQQDKQFIASAQSLPNAGAAKTIIGGTDGIGTYVTDMWIEFAIERPSVVVQTKDNSPARPFSDALRVEYAPIVVYDRPAEMAYMHKDIPEPVLLDIEALELSEADADPTTCQNFEGTPKGIMQDLMQGNVINVTFPFCSNAGQCADVAETIFHYQSYGQVNTYSLTCGPNDEPELGARVDGYDDNLRIDSISYSYSHGSSYNIEVSLGPVFSNIGSWNTGTFVGTYEDVSREAIVVWSGGDGVNYRVNVQGLGEYNAINTKEMVWRVGERVKVTLKNVPKENV